MVKSTCFWIVPAVSLLLLIATGLRAESFRIETAVYAAGEEEPLGKNLTLFTDGLVYDYTLTGAAQTIVFKPGVNRPAGRFILLNIDREERTEVAAERVERLAASVAAWAKQQENPLLKFSGDPEFEESFDEKQEEFLFRSPVMEYRVKTLAAQSEAASNIYREFADAFARLDTLLHPGSRPPHARLKVNRALASRQLIPREVHLRLGPSDSKRRDNDIHSEHQVAWRLTREDHERIDETSQQLVTFRLVDLESFRR